MKFKCVNKDCDCFNEVVHYYTVSFKWDSTGKCIPNKECTSCKQSLESIPDGIPISEKNISLDELSMSSNKQWTKGGKNPIY